MNLGRHRLLLRLLNETETKMESRKEKKLQKKMIKIDFRVNDNSKFRVKKNGVHNF